LESWDSQAQFITSKGAEYQAVAFDNIGSSYSTIPENAFTHTIYAMAMDAFALASFLNWKEFHLVGISMGGMIAMEMASRQPARLKSLTLINTHPGGLATNLFPPPSGGFYLVRTMFTNAPEKKARILLSLLYSKETTKDISKKTRLYEHRLRILNKNKQPSSLKGFFAQWLAIMKHYVSVARLQEIKQSGVPVLVMVGTDDILIYPSNSHTLHKHLGGELIEYRGGHAVVNELPELVNSALEAHFIKAENVWKKGERSALGNTSFRDFLITTTQILTMVLLPILGIVYYYMWK